VSALLFGVPARKKWPVRAEDAYRGPTVAAPLTSPRQGVLAPTSRLSGSTNQWTITDTESRLSVAGGRLQGDGPHTAGWNKLKVVGPGFSRLAGRSFSVLVTLEDFSNIIAAGWATAGNIADPRTDGYGFCSGDASNANGGLFTAIQPGKQMVIGSNIRNFRSMQYLLTFVQDTNGAAVLLSTPADDTGHGMDGPVPIAGYPNARLLWVWPFGTEATLYPYISAYNEIVSYPHGHVWEDARVVDVAAWAGGDALAGAIDRFTRANGSLGGAWTIRSGTWSILSNRAHILTDAGNAIATQPHIASSTGNGLYAYRFTIKAGFAPNFYLILRYQDASNFVYLTNAGTVNAGSTYALRKVVAGVQSNIATGAVSSNWVDGQTYTVMIAVQDAQYQFWIVENSTNTSGWLTDAGAFLVGQTLSWGIGGNAGYAPNGADFDLAAVYPHSVALPTEIKRGRVPQIWTGGTTLVSDTFTDANSTRLSAHTPTLGGAWTETPSVTGNIWEIQGNKAKNTHDAAHGNGMAYQSVGVLDAECQVDISTPATFTTSWLSAIAFRVVNASNYGYVALLRHVSQPGADEVECHEVIAGVDTVVHKPNVGSAWSTSSTYTEKLQVRGDKVQVYVDGKPRATFFLSPSFLAVQGTGFGLFSHATDEGLTFDNWTVKAL
jgi:hypothetical protein